MEIVSHENGTTLRLQPVDTRVLLIGRSTSLLSQMLNIPLDSHSLVDAKSPVNLKVTHTVITVASLVPLRYDEETDGIVYASVHASSEKRCVDLIFKFDEVNTLEALRFALTPMLHKLRENIESQDAHCFAKMINAQPYVESPAKYLIIRVWFNADFKCAEHPEYLIGEPLGQYHCPRCNEMVVAGCLH